MKADIKLDRMFCLWWVSGSVYWVSITSFLLQATIQILNAGIVTLIGNQVDSDQADNSRGSVIIQLPTFNF